MADRLNSAEQTKGKPCRSAWRTDRERLAYNGLDTEPRAGGRTQQDVTMTGNSEGTASALTAGSAATVVDSGASAIQLQEIIATQSHPSGQFQSCAVPESKLPK